MAVSHVFTSPVADMTGTVTVFNSLGATATTEASALVRPTNWNSVHNQYMTLSGNTAGASTMSGTNIVLQGGNNVTLSANGVSLVISGPNTAAQSVQTQNMVSINGSTGAIEFSNSNNVSFGVNASTITASASFSQSVQTQSNVQGISAGTQVGRTGDIVFSNSNGVTFGMSGSTRVTASVETSYAASNHSHGNPTLNLTNLSGTTASNSAGFTLSLSAAAPGAVTLTNYATGNTTQSSSGTIAGSSIIFRGSGGVSAGISNGSYILEGPALTSLSATGALSASSNGSTISLGVGTVTASAVGNTTQSSSGTINLNALVFSGAGNVSVGYSAGSVILSGGTAAAAPVNFSAGTTSNNLGTVVFSNSNGVSFGLNGSTITASVNAGGGGGVGLGVSTMGNTAGTTGTVTTGNVVLVGSGVISLSQSSSGSNATISILAPATSSLSATGNASLSVNGSTISIGANAAAVSLSGNSTSAGAGYSNVSSGTLILAGGNNITLSQNGASVTISGANAGGAQTGISGIVVSDATYTSGTVSFSNANGISFGSSAGQAITASYTVPAAQTGVSGIANSQTTYTSGTVSFSELGAITIRSTTGNQFQFSVNAQSVVPGIQSIQVSDTTYTTGNVIFSNANGASFGSSAGGAVTLSYTRPVVSNAIQPVGSATGSGTNTSRFAADDHVHEGVFSMGVSTAGNTIGDTRVGAGRFVLQGGNNVTLSQITAANGLNTIVFSGGAAGAADGINALVVNGGASTATTTLTLSNSNNVSFGHAAGVITATATFAQTAQTQSNVQGIIVSNTTYRTGDVSFSNANGISFGSSAGQAITASYTVPTQTAQTLGLYASSQTTGQSSSSTVDARSLTFVGQGNISVGLSGGSYLISGAGGGGGVAVSAAGNSVSNGTVVFSNSNNVSFGMNASTITATATFAQTNQTGGIYFTAQTTGQSSSSTYDLRTLSVVGDGIVSAGWSNGTVRISATQSNQAFSADASSTFQTLTFQNSNGISFSNNAGALRITHDLAFSSQTNLTGRIYVTAQSTGQSSSSTYDLRTLSIVPDGIISAGWSGGSFRISATQSNQAVSNSAGSFTFQTLNFSNANNVTFGTSAGGIITASVAAGGGGIAASISGNSTSGGAGYSNITSGTMILAGGPNITLSQDGSRISISANAPGAAAENNWMNLLGANTSGNTTASGSTLGLSGINMTLSGTNGSVINLSVPATSSLSATGAVSLSTNGSTISIGALNFSVSQVERNWGTVTVNVWNNATFSRRPIFVPFEMHAHLSAVSSIQIAVSRSGGTSLACTYFAGIYTLANSTSMNLLSSTSFNVSLTTSAQFSGIRVMNFTGLGAMSLTPGQYVMGFLASDGGTASNGLNMLGHVVFNNAGFILSGTNSTAATASNSLLAPMFGVFNATSGSMPGAVAFSSISGGASANAPRVGFVLRAN